MGQFKDLIRHSGHGLARIQ